MIIACPRRFLRSLERHRDGDADRHDATQADEPESVAGLFDLLSGCLVRLSHDYLLETDATWLIAMRISDSGL